MSIVLDVLVLAVVTLFIFSGFKRGVISRAIHFAGAAVSALLSAIIAPLLAVNLYDSFVGEKLQGLISRKLPDLYMGIKPEEVTNKLMNDLPDFVLNALGLCEVDKNKINEQISQGMDNIPYIISDLLKPVTLKLLTIILSLTIFTIISAIISIATRGLTSSLDVSGLSAVNKTLGAILGLLPAAIIIMILSFVIYILIVFLPQDSARYLNMAVDNTFLFRHIYYDMNVLGQLMTVILGGGG